MITATMNVQDIWNSVCQNRERLRDVASGVAWKLTKEARKRRVNGVWKCMDYSHDGTKYKIAVHGKRDTSWDWACYIYCAENNMYVRMAYSAMAMMCVKKLNVQAFAPHFIRRVSERFYHDSIFDMNRTIARLERDIIVSKRLLFACLYYDESTEDVVYNFLGGIALGNIDSAKRITFFKTFVSYDMLKDSQRRAYDACTGLQTTMREKYGDDKKIGRRMCADKAFAFAVNKELDACKPIYAEFFKKIKANEKAQKTHRRREGLHTQASTTVNMCASGQRLGA